MVGDPVFIQWKGTEVCMDLRCPCGAHNHIDAEFAYYVRCGRCDTVFEMGTSVSIKPVIDWRMEPINGEVL